MISGFPITAPGRGFPFNFPVANDTGRFGIPALDLNFLVTETLDPRITFTRASSATRYNSSGLLEVVSSGSPRFDYDPVTRAPRGLLVEEQRVNICIASEELNLWTLTNATVSSNATTAPDGASTADKLVEDTATGNHLAGRSVTYLTATVYTVSVFAKAAERFEFSINMSSTPFGGSSPNVRFNLTTQGIINANGAVGSIQDVGNGWFRCVAVLPATSSGATAIFPRFFLFNNSGSVSYTGDGTSGLFLWGAQVEAGAFATSYIPTTSGSTATRASDAPILDQTGWYVAGPGTYAVAFRTAISGSSRRIINTLGTTDGILGVHSSNTLESFNGTTALRTVNSFSTSNVILGATSYDSSGRSLVMNGGAVASDALLVQTATSGFRLGNRNPLEFLNGHIGRIRYWQRRFSDSDLQAVTV